MVSNIIAIRGEKQSVLKFLGISELECGDFELDRHLRDWLPGTDFYLNNINELGVKYNSAFTSWECQEDDEDNTLVLGFIETTHIPDRWIEVMRVKYPKLDFYIFSTSEKYTEYRQVVLDGEPTERIRCYSVAEKEIYDNYSNLLRTHFFNFINL